MQAVYVVWWLMCLEQQQRMVFQEYTHRTGWLRGFCEFPAAFPACFQLFLQSWGRAVSCEGLVVQGSLRHRECSKCSGTHCRRSDSNHGGFNFLKMKYSAVL